MPRSERDLDENSDDPVLRFAIDLRKLRVEAGGINYREMARLANFGASTLSEAVNGRKPPSLPVALAYVRACGGDEAAWEKRWHEVTALLKEQNRALAETGGSAEQRCPYVGLGAYQQQDADRFHGRDALTATVLNRVRSGRLLMLFGASGSGKSSLLRAGLMPGLHTRDEPAGVVPWPTVLFTPGAHPIDECAARIADLGVGVASALRRELLTDPRALHLAVLQAMTGWGSGEDLVLIVDQFEEVFTLCQDREERSAFITGLLTASRAANSRIRIVVGALGRVPISPTRPVLSLAFYPDGKTLVGGFSDGTIHELDITDRNHLTPVGRDLSGGVDPITSVAVSADERTLASASQDHTIRLWELTDPAHPRAINDPLDTAFPPFMFDDDEREGRPVGRPSLI